MSTIDECTPCPSGYFCRDKGSVAPTGMCKAGHICYGSATDDDPVYNNDTAGNKTIILYGDLCWPGYYCPQGTSLMVECPRGTYNPDKGGVSAEAACKPCDAGQYCNGTALTAVTGSCSFY